jgi:hypothetical protein
MRSIFTQPHHLPVKKLLVYLTAFFSFNFTATAQSPPVLIFNPVVSGLSASLDVVNAGDGTNRLFIVQRGGTVRIADAGILLPGNF